MENINNKCECSFCKKDDNNSPIIVIENSKIECENFSKRVEKSRNEIISYFANKHFFNYFIGAFWINDEESLIIKPKVENIDFFAMFEKCLKYNEIIKDFHKIYNISFDEKPILNKDNKLTNELDILLAVHFLRLLELELHNGLKKNFIRKKENLNSKIKGKIEFSNHIKHNIIKNRNDRIFCSYLDYDVNCLENRILKKALKICMNKLASIKHNYNYCISFFNEVSDELYLYELNKIRLNPLYKKYKVLIELAVKIIKMKRFKDSDTKNIAPPFYINMPLLFEKYVYSLLIDKANEFHYEVLYNNPYLRGSFIPDFIIKSNDDNLQYIADTKYKNIYNNKYNKNDILQLSGYSRTKKVVDKFTKDVKNYIPKCLIIYPHQNSCREINFDNIPEIKQFIEFYKLPISLPVINK